MIYIVRSTNNKTNDSIYIQCQFQLSKENCVEKQRGRITEKNLIRWLGFKKKQEN